MQTYSQRFKCILREITSSLAVRPWCALKHTAAQNVSNVSPLCEAKHIWIQPYNQHTSQWLMVMGKSFLITTYAALPFRVPNPITSPDLFVYHLLLLGWSNFAH